MSKPFTPTPHPVLRLPSAEESVAMGERKWQEAMARREEIIRNEKVDPFNNCWEPPIWKVCDALLGFPWVDPKWAEDVRRALKFTKPVSILLINGGQRGGKSEYAAHRSMRILRMTEGAKTWALHSSLEMSRTWQQPLFWKFMPAQWKEKDIKERITYIAYKQKTGFSEEKFVLPPPRTGAAGSECIFKAYEQDKKQIEGGNLELIWNDELVPSDWVETMELRIAEKAGRMLVTFTPIEGYTETVRMFQDGAEVVKESVAFLCPKDGGPPDPARALGMTEEQYAELQAAAAHKDEHGRIVGRAALFPQTIPQDCDAWLTGGTGQPPVPEGREFEKVPRVLKCVGTEEKRAVVFFHSSDNPYGNPKNVWATIASKSREFIKERFYGMATKTLSARFVKFDRDAHTIAPEAVPALGTNYLIADPCGGRNFFMSWFRVTPEHVYLYREWPSSEPIPGVGLPGPWALPDGKKPDGRQGPAQKPFGWGLLDYKREIARLERWKEYDETADLNHPNWKDGDKKSVLQWDEAEGAEERIEERLIDSRFASSAHIERDRPVTLLTELEDIGLFFKPTAGGGEHGEGISEGSNLIDDALTYDKDKDIGYFNKPRLLISRACTNSIYAVTTWTGFTINGTRKMDGATKDPIDNKRYFFLSDLPYVGSAEDQTDDEDEEGSNQSY